MASHAEALAAQLKELTKELEAAKSQIAASRIDGLFESADDVDGIRVATAYFSGTSADTLRSMCEKAREKAPNSVVALVGSAEGKLTLAVSCSANAVARGLKAGVLVKDIAAIAGGKGGGKPDFAMAGIKDANKVDEALNAVSEIVRKNLK